MHVRPLTELDVASKRVLLREDLNVPMRGSAIADATRIDAALPTIELLRSRGARTIVVSHLGRPGGRPDPRLTLRPVAQALSDRLGAKVAFAGDCVGETASAAAAALRDGDVLLLENVRFHPEEERNDPSFARSLASLADLYVNDAFGTAHRAHASTEGVAHLLPSAAGLLMLAELDALSKLTCDPHKPFVCAIGGAKVKDKIGVLAQLMERVDALCVGGGMANTFLAASGADVGRSLRDDDLEPARQIADRAQRHGVTLHLPTDAVVAESFDASQSRVATIGGIGGAMILDIGPETASAYASVIREAKTIVFNGPMGVYEKPAYRHGTEIVGAAIADATAHGAFSVVGGGDAAAAAHELGFAGGVSFVSTGGGATLEFLEGKSLPGVAALALR